MSYEATNKSEGEEVDIDSLLDEGQSNPNTQSQPIETSKATPRVVATSTGQGVQSSPTVTEPFVRCSNQQREFTDLGTQSV